MGRQHIWKGQFFRVKNFEKYQPKRNGKNAPWIRLYHGWNLDAKVGDLHDSHKAHWIGILSMCHTEDNRVPYSNTWVKKRGLFNSPVKLELFMELGLIEILDDKVLPVSVPESPGERKKEKEKEKYIHNESEEVPEKDSHPYDIRDAFEEDWGAYPRKAGSKEKAFKCYWKTVGNNLEINRPLFQGKMKEYVDSVDDQGYLKHGETFFRNWKDLVVCNIRPIRNESYEDKHEREMSEMRERLNANNT